MASPTPAEQALVAQVFAVGDPQKFGILTGESALKVFAGTRLSSTVLGEIWALADSDNNGFLTKKSTAIALRLIGHAQNGESITADLVNKPGPIPTIDGIARSNTSTPVPGSPRPVPSAATVLPPFTSQDKTKFLRIFANSGPANGLLSGEKAKDIFLKSKLPFEKLSQIWQLADTHGRGAMDAVDFSIAMYFVQACMANSSLILPQTLPPSIYDQAGGRTSSVISHTTGSSTTAGQSSPLSSSFSSMTQSQIKPQLTGSAMNKITPQYTGQVLQPQVTGQRLNPIPTQPSTSTISPFPNAIRGPTNQVWDITSQEKATADGFYRTLDTQNKGFIEGDVAVPFLLQSGLPGDVLAQVWDLADFQNTGKLTADSFAVAMHLVNGKLVGKPLPEKLPDTLIPPTMRPTSTITAPVSQIQRDLFSLENSPPGSPIIPESAGPFTNPKPSVLHPQSTGTQGPHLPAPFSFTPNVFPPPVPARLTTAPPPVPQAQAIQDLLGDDEESAAENAQIHANAAEIGNLNNQIASTQRSLKSTQEERKTLEETVAAQAAQLESLKSQLTTATTAYDTEKKLLGNLQERMASQNGEIQKTREEIIRAESDLSALRLEKSEIEGSVLRDKEEIRELQRKMKETADGSEALKTELEKAKKEARQQKGLLAIAKKQLTSSETDKEKVLKELETAKADLEQMQKEIEVTQTMATENAQSIEALRTEIAVTKATTPPPATVAARVPIPETPELQTPRSVSSGKSTNPFERLAFTNPTAVPPTSGSPFKPFTLLSEEVSGEVQSSQKDAEVTGIEEDPFSVVQEAVDAPFSPNHQDSTVPAVPELELNIPKPTEGTADTSGMEPLIEGTGTMGNAQVVISSVSQSASGANETPGEFAPIAEIEQSDDSDSSDEEFHDAKSPGTATVNDLFAAEDSTPMKPPGLTNGDAERQETPVPTSFDDAFGETGVSVEKSSATAPAVPVDPASDPSPEQTTVSSPSLPQSHTNPSIPTSSPLSVLPEPPTKSPPAGITLFDEAFGKPSGLEPSVDSSFRFESNFNDTFDFGSSNDKTAPVGAPEPNGISAIPASAPESLPLEPVRSNGSLPIIETGAFSFDDAFGSSSSATPAQANTLANGSETKVVSFDDAFSDPTKPAANAEPIPMPAAKSSEMAPSPPVSPVRTTMSSRRSMSPPARPSSPLSKMSRRKSSVPKLTSTEEKEKRSTKISLRFPFGRKGKEKEKDKDKKRFAPPAGPPPGDYLNAGSNASGVGTPAVDDDAEALKNLCQMGFSRSQALEALEAHNFDMQRALNALLGAPERA